MTLPKLNKHTRKAGIETALRELLPVQDDAGMYGLQIDTVFGRLRISPCDQAIRTRFDEVPPVEPVGTSLNPYSGKWNFEGLYDASDVARAIGWIRRIAK